MIYHIFANKSNIGDWLSAKGIQSALTGYPITELLCDAPFVEDTIARLRSVRPDDFVIIGGGGLFMDYFVPFWEELLKIADKLQFGIWGVGYCDITHESTLPPVALIEDIVRRSRFCYVRDELTREHLAAVKLPPPVSCPSLLCLSKGRPGGLGMLHVDNYTTVGSAAFEVMDACCRKFAGDTGRSYRRTNNRIQGTDGQLLACMQLYHEADLVVSSALHGCIIGVSLNKRVVAVSGDRKIDSFMSAVGLSDWVCGNNEVERLTELLAEVKNQSTPDQSLQHLRRANEQVGEVVRRLLLSKRSSSNTSHE